MTTTSNSNSNVDASELIEADYEEWFVNLERISTALQKGRLETDFESKDFGLDEGERFAIDFDETFAFLFQFVS